MWEADVGITETRCWKVKAKAKGISNGRAPRLSDKNIFYQPTSPTDGVTFLTEGIQGLISTNFLEWDDG